MHNEIHEAFRKLAQEIWDKQNVCVKSVHFQWLDGFTTKPSNQYLLDIRIETTSVAK